MELQKNTFKKQERLNSVEAIGRLFTEGKSTFLYPFKVVYLVKPMNLKPPVKILVVVPKKICKRAVDRNHLKRLTREAYRVHKHELWNSQSNKGQQLLLGFIYIGKTILTYSEIEKKLILILQRLSK